MDFDDYMRGVDRLIERLRILLTQNCIRILQMLEEPKYWTQLVEELNMHKWLVKKYLDRLMEAGIIESFVKPSERGPPRRYYKLARELAILLLISSGGIFIREYPVEVGQQVAMEVLSKYPSVRRLFEEPQSATREKIEEEIKSLIAAIRLLIELLKRSK